MSLDFNTKQMKTTRNKKCARGDSELNIVLLSVYLCTLLQRRIFKESTVNVNACCCPCRQ